MSDDRTTPHRQQQWSRRADADEQETVYADSERVTPPTIPLGDQERAAPGRGGGGFARTIPSEGVTPRPAQPFGVTPTPTYPAAEEAQGQTMIIGPRLAPTFAWLVVTDSPNRADIGKVHTLQPETTTIGRVRGNNIVIHDEHCSAQHARIRVERKEGAEPAYVLFDMGSKNKTYVGDRETYKNEENAKYRHELQDGDYLLIGETTLVFKKV